MIDPRPHDAQNEPAPQNDSPFLPTKDDELPKLKPIAIPTGAVAEFIQQMASKPIDLPIQRSRNSTRVRAYSPTAGCSLSFKYAFEGFCSARRVVSTTCTSESESMLGSEQIELLAHFNGDAAQYGSVAPRGLCINLLIPKECTYSPTAIPYIDAIAAISNGKLNDRVPITTKIRFGIYGADAIIPASRTILRDAYDNKTVDTVSVMVRWSVWGESGAAVVRTECMALNTTLSSMEQASRVLQMAVIKLSTAFGFKLLPEFFSDPPESTDAYFERQVVECSTEFCNLLHKEEPFVPSERMTKSSNCLLRQIPNCYARLTPIALGLEGVVSPDSIHAMLLCAYGMEERALSYVKRYREGLRPPEGKDEDMDLHTAAVQTERVYLNGMISLYAHGGKVGESIHADGNWVYTTTAAIVPVRSLMTNFYVFGCGIDSLFPDNAALLKHMDTHVSKSIHLYTRLFEQVDQRHNTSTRLVESAEVSRGGRCNIPDEQRFALSALGIELQSNRMLIGDALVFLARHGANKSLVDLLTSASLRVGLRTSLQEGFASCVDAMQTDKNARDARCMEMERLKRVADAALVLGSRKRACAIIPNTKPEKVKQLINAFSLKVGVCKTRLENYVYTPRSPDDAHKLSLTVYESYARKAASDMPHIKELETVMQTYIDLSGAIAKCLRICMLKPGRPKQAFVFLHGHNMANVSINRVSHNGDLTPCGSGAVFEADTPCIVVVKLQSDVACIVTPLVIQGK